MDYPHQSPFLYSNEKNVFHQIRRKMLENFQYLHFHMEKDDYTLEDYKNIFQKKDEKESKIPYSVQQFQGKLKTLQNKKLRRKGQLKDTTEEEQNLQKNEGEHFEFKDIWSKIISIEDNDKKILWKNLEKEEQWEAILKYLERYKDKTKIYDELVLDVKNKFDENFFDTHKVLKWSKNSGKIYEIEKLIISPKMFYWNL